MEVWDGIKFGIGLFIALLSIVVVLALIVATAEEVNDIKRHKHGKGNNGKGKKHGKR